MDYMQDCDKTMISTLSLFRLQELLVNQEAVEMETTKLFLQVEEG